MMKRLQKLEEMMATLKDLNGLTARTLKSLGPELEELRDEAHGQGQLGLGEEGEEGARVRPVAGAAVSSPPGVWRCVQCGETFSESSPALAVTLKEPGTVMDREVYPLCAACCRGLRGGPDEDAPVGVAELEGEVARLNQCLEEAIAARNTHYDSRNEAREERDKEKQLATAAVEETAKALAAKQELATENERLQGVLVELHKRAKDANWEGVMRILEKEVEGVSQGGVATA